MPTVLKQECDWPGVLNGFASVSYVLSHGVMPSKIFAVTNPQDEGLPDEYGDFVIGDGTRFFIVKDCKLESVTERISGGGRYWELTILDRRWRWKTGVHRGRYNQQGPNSKLVPWSIRSLPELLKMLLGNKPDREDGGLGERDYTVVLPADQDPGIPQSAGTDVGDYFRPGQQLRPSAGNPPCNWEGGVPPALAIQELIDRFGMRIMLDPITDKVAVLPLGYAIGPIPDLSQPLAADSAGASAPAIPKSLNLLGAEILYQRRFLFEPVGRDFDGQFLPLNQLSYAPINATDKIQFGIVRATGPVAADYSVSITTPDGSTTKTFFSATLSGLAEFINADPVVATFCSAASVGSQLSFAGITPGEAFGVSAAFTGGSSTAVPPTAFVVKLTQVPGKKGPDWRFCSPPWFPSAVATANSTSVSAVKPTDYLSKNQAMTLARDYVWKAFRLTLIDPSDWKDKKKPFPTKGFPDKFKLVRRHQVVITPEQVNQVVPLPRNLDGTVVAGNPSGSVGVMPDFYNGVSQSRPAMAFAEYAVGIGSVIWGLAGDPKNPGDRRSQNYKRGSRVHIPFSIVPDEQVVIFSNYIYRRLFAANEPIYEDPGIVIETGYVITDKDTSASVRYKKTITSSIGVAPPAYSLRNDVHVGNVARYDDKDNLLDAAEVDLAGHGKAAADYYLKGMVKKFQFPEAAVHTFIGIIEAHPDGLVHQITWRLGSQVVTEVCLNTEASDVVPPFPDRQLKEMLPPDRLGALQNWGDNFSGPAAAGAAVGKAGASLLKAVGGPLGSAIGGQ